MGKSNKGGSVVQFPSSRSAQSDAPYREPLTVGLSGRGKFVARVCVALPCLYLLGMLAFTPAGMRGFMAGLVNTIGWLGGSPDGNRVGGFVIFALAVVGGIAVLKSAIVLNHGLGGWGWLQVVIGVALLCGGGDGWYVGHVGWLWAIVMVIAGWVLTAKGYENIKSDQGAPITPQFQTQQLPEQGVYGKARAALDHEIHSALRDKPRVAPDIRVNNGGYRYKR